MARVMLAHASYGGGAGKVTMLAGEANLVATEDAIGLGTVNPKKAMVAWSDVEWIDVEDDEVRKSRAGKVALLGPVGLLARKTEKAADVTVRTKAGADVRYQVKKMGAFQVRAKLDEVVSKVGVPWRDNLPRPGSDSTGEQDIANQIRKLAELRDAGVLTEEEFTAKKTELLARM